MATMEHTFKLSDALEDSKMFLSHLRKKMEEIQPRLERLDKRNYQRKMVHSLQSSVWNYEKMVHSLRSSLGNYQTIVDSIRSSVRSYRGTAESLRSSLEAEARRVKKTMEGDLDEMEIQLSRAERQAVDAQKQLKSLRAFLSDPSVSDDTDEDLKESVALLERRFDSVQAELELLRAALERTERGRKQAERELTAAECTQNTCSIVEQRKKHEDDLRHLQAEVEKAIRENRKAQEQAEQAITHSATIRLRILLELSS